MRSFPAQSIVFLFLFLKTRLPCHEERAYTLPESTWLCQFLRADCCVALLSPVVSEVLVAAWTRPQQEYLHHRTWQRL